MNVVNPDNYSQGPLPTVFEDRTLFPQPHPVQDAKFKKTRGGGGGGGAGSAFMIFLAMLVPCAILGWLMYTQNAKIADLEKAVSTVGVEKTDALRAEMSVLEDEISTLETGIVATDEGIGRLIRDREDKLLEVNWLLADRERDASLERKRKEEAAKAQAIADGTYDETKDPPFPAVPETETEKRIAAYKAALAELDTVPTDWDKSAVEALTQHVADVEAHRQAVISWSAPRPTPARPVVPNEGSVVPGGVVPG